MLTAGDIPHPFSDLTANARISYNVKLVFVRFVEPTRFYDFLSSSRAVT